MKHLGIPAERCYMDDDDDDDDDDYNFCCCCFHKFCYSVVKTSH